MLLQERSQLSSGLRVDREAGVISGVKIIGTKSANKREYPIQVLTAAAPMYENAVVKIDHPTLPNQPRSVADSFGALREVTVRPTGPDAGLYGNLHYLKSHRLANQIAESAERFPDKLGLSHNADGSGRHAKDGTFVVESIARVISVDIVGDPATNKSLFEGLELRSFKLADVIGRLPIDDPKRAALLTLVEEAEYDAEKPMAAKAKAPADPNDPAADPNADPNNPAAGMQPEEPPSPEEAVETAFRAEIVRAFDDSSLDSTAKAARIRSVLTAHEKVLDAMSATATATGGAAAPAATDPKAAAAAAATPAAPIKEGVADEMGELREKLRIMETREEVREELREAKKEVSAEQFAALCATPKEARKVLLEAIGTKAATPTPANGGTNPKPRTTGQTAATGGEGEKLGYERGKRFTEHLKRPNVGSLLSQN